MGRAGWAATLHPQASEGATAAAGVRSLARIHHPPGRRVHRQNHAEPSDPALGAPYLGESVLGTYRADTGDRPPPGV
jgi:hypothetical protein